MFVVHRSWRPPLTDQEKQEKAAKAKKKKSVKSEASSEPEKLPGKKNRYVVLFHACYQHVCKYP